mmetsp:Transcript_16849/g.46280  ORF Transcript_16849/g.46280 Transcript_16849/m.46280 type:complete len:103 (+) Transcript_16849:1747-2055(+)
MVFVAKHSRRGSVVAAAEKEAVAADVAAPLEFLPTVLVATVAATVVFVGDDGGDDAAAERIDSVGEGLSVQPELATLISYLISVAAKDKWEFDVSEWVARLR